jgi:small ligand-binding sensory domain FIST
VTIAAAGLSEHPVPAHAAGDAFGAVLDQLGPEPDLVSVFVTGNHAGALDDITRAATQILRPRALVGVAASGVLGGGREVEEQPGVAVFAARCGGLTPVRLRAARMESGWNVSGLPRSAADGERTLVLLADPHSFPADSFLEHLARHAPGLRVVGGLTSGALGPGGARLVVDGQEHTEGAVGLLLGPDAPVVTVVSQGCRPIGAPFVVTGADGRHLLELGGRPAIDRLRDILEDLDPADRLLATRSLQVGFVIDEAQATFGRGDFMVRPVMSVDARSGSVTVADDVAVGRTVQFQLRDKEAAADDLRDALSGIRADGALVFTCTGRGRRLFDRPDHDAETIAELLGTRAAAGMFSAGEFGPVAGRSVVHSSSVSLALFGPRSA